MSHKIMLYAITAVLFMACGDVPTDAGGTGEEAMNDTVPRTVVGYYTNMAVTTDIPSVEVELWLHPDSSFILRTTLRGPDPQTTGGAGSWSMHGDSLLLGPGPSDVGRFTKDGLILGAGRGTLVAPILGARMDVVPAMDLIGEYRFEADLHSFTPCGSERVFPLAVAEGDMGLEALSEKQGKGPLVVELTCTLGPAEAAEGEAPDVYVFPKRLVRVLDECPPAVLDLP
ncbi:MAG: hypothetical protein R2815_02085 [Flavobacteriales bacterium]